MQDLSIYKAENGKFTKYDARRCQAAVQGKCGNTLAHWWRDLWSIEYWRIDSAWPNVKREVKFCNKEDPWTYGG